MSPLHSSLEWRQALIYSNFMANRHGFPPSFVLVALVLPFLNRAQFYIMQNYHESVRVHSIKYRLPQITYITDQMDEVLSSGDLAEKQLYRILLSDSKT